MEKVTMHKMVLSSIETGIQLSQSDIFEMVAKKHFDGKLTFRKRNYIKAKISQMVHKGELIRIFQSYNKYTYVKIIPTQL